MVLPLSSLPVDPLNKLDTKAGFCIALYWKTHYRIGGKGLRILTNISPNSNLEMWESPRTSHGFLSSCRYFVAMADMSLALSFLVYGDSQQSAQGLVFSPYGLYMLSVLIECICSPMKLFWKYPDQPSAVFLFPLFPQMFNLLYFFWLSIPLLIYQSVEDNWAFWLVSIFAVKRDESLVMQRAEFLANCVILKISRGKHDGEKKFIQVIAGSNLRIAKTRFSKEHLD